MIIYEKDMYARNAFFLSYNICDELKVMDDAEAKEIEEDRKSIHEIKVGGSEKVGRVAMGALLGGMVGSMTGALLLLPLTAILPEVVAIGVFITYLSGTTIGGGVLARNGVESSDFQESKGYKEANIANRRFARLVAKVNELSNLIGRIDTSAETRNQLSRASGFFQATIKKYERLYQ